MTAIERILKRLVAYQFAGPASAIAETHQLPLKLVLSRDRTARVCAARDELWTTVYGREGWTYVMVGELFERDWTTVRTGVDRHLNKQRMAA